MNRYNGKKKRGIIFIVIGILLLVWVNNSNDGNDKNIRRSNSFNIIASTSTRGMNKDIIKYGKKNNIKINIENYGDLEIVDILNNNSKDYDAVWISNSIWLYMLDNTNLTTDSKSIVIDPVVMAVKKSKAMELGFVGNDIYNKDILNAIKDKKLKYVMSSVTKTNTGATTYLTFLNSLAGSPEVLTEDMLDNENLQNNMINFFTGVERVSGDENYLSTMFLNGEYDAMINYESSLINLNKELIKKNREPLYLIYPKDGVAINDMPFAYINNNSTDTKRKEYFNKIQTYLRSDDVIKKMEKMGYRSWYGGVKENTDKDVFNPNWGIDTSKYLKDMNYPSKKVITKAINLYIEKFRKPTHVVFCLDISGSMYGEGLEELKEAMNYILDYEMASEDNLQFSSKDKITIITFSSGVKKVYDTKDGEHTDEIINYISNLVTGGGTDIYTPSEKALEILKKENNDYTKTVILMTDGEANTGSFKDLNNYYRKNHLDIPIYSITFGESSEKQLKEIANLTNGKIFDGKQGLKKAFSEVRSYN